MPKFKVEIYDNLVTTYIVTAKNKSEANELADQMHEDGDKPDDVQCTDRFSNVTLSK